MKKLLLFLSVLWFGLAQASAATYDVDKTDAVDVAPAAWGGTNTYNHDVTTSDGRATKMVEHYYGQLAQNEELPLKQTVTGLPNGKYTVTLIAKTNCANWDFNVPEDFVDGSYEYASVFACPGASYSPAKAQTKAIEADVDKGYARAPQEYTVEANVTDGNLTIGMVLHDMNKTNWHTIQIKSLILHSDAPIAEPVNITSAAGLSDNNATVWKRDNAGGNWGNQYLGTTDAWEQWIGQPGNLNNRIMYRTTQLPAGTYTVKASINALQQDGGAPTDKNVDFYVQAGSNVQKVNCYGDYAARELEITLDDAAEVEIGIRSYTEGTVNWVAQKNLRVTTTSYSTLDEFNAAYAPLKLANAYAELETAYNNALNNLDEEGKAHFIELAATIKAALDGKTYTTEADIKAAIKDVQTYLVQSAYYVEGEDVTNLITNAAIANGNGWDTPRTNSGQQYNGAPDNTYLDFWNNSGTVQTSQKINVPAGTYALLAATRSSNGEDGKIYAKVGETEFSAPIFKDGADGGQLGGGWSVTKVKDIVVPVEQEVEIGFYCTTPDGNWAGADDFRLIKTGEAAPADDTVYGTFAAPVALEDGKTYGLNADATGGKFNYYTFESAEDVKITLTTTPGTNPGGGFGVSTGGFMLNDNGEDLSGYVMLGEDDLTTEMKAAGEGGSNEGGDDEFGVGFGKFIISTSWNAKAGVKYYIMCQGVGTFNVALSEAETGVKVGTMSNPINLNEHPTWTWGTDGKVPGSATYYTYKAEKDGNLTISNSNEDIYVGEDGWYDPFVNTGGPQYTGEIQKTTDWAAYTATHTFAVEEGVTYCITIFDLTKGNEGEVIKAEFAEAAPSDEAATIFKWANVTGADDYVAEAGTIECLGGDKNDRLNYANTALEVPYKTICLNGKKGNLGDGTTNGTYMKVTPTQALKAGDVIAMTAYRNKDAMGKKATAALIFSNGASAVMGTSPEFPNLNAAGENPTGAPETIELTVTEEMAGATSINLTRQDASTNLFITSLIITSAGAEAVVPVESVSIVDADNTILDGSTYICEEGETLQLTAVITPENATNKNVTWEVLQDAEVVTFENGLVTAVGPGKAAIVVTTEDGEKQAFVSIFVKEKAPVKESTTFEITNDGLDVTITPSNDNEYIYAVTIPEIDDLLEEMVGKKLSNEETFTMMASMMPNLKTSGVVTFNAMEDYLEYLGAEDLEPGTNIKVLVAEVEEADVDGETMLVPTGEIFAHEFTYGEGGGEADNVEWDPAPGDIDYNSFGGKLDQVILTFTDAGMVELNDIPFKANIEDETGREVDSMYGVNFYFLGMNQACITFNKGVTADGTYTINVPAGLFTLTMPDGSTKASSELHATYNVTGAGEGPVAGDKMQILPAEGNVTSLQQFTLVINDWDSQFDNYNSQAKFYKNGEFVEDVAFDYDPENWTDPNLYGSLSAPVTEDGTYTLEFPVGSMTTNSWATSNSEPVVYTWTIGEGGGVEELSYGTFAEPIALEEGKTYGLNAAETGTPNFYTFESDKDVKVILTPTEGSIVEGGFNISTGNFLMDDQFNDLEGAEYVEAMMEPVEGGEPGIGGDDDFDFGFGFGRMATTWTAKAGVKYYIIAMGQGAFDVALDEPEEYVGTMDTPINLNETTEWTWGTDGKVPGSATYYTYTAEKDGNLTVFVSNCAENQLFVGEGGWYDSWVHTEGPAYTGEIKTEYNWGAWTETNTFAVEAGTTYFITIFDLSNETVKVSFEEATGIRAAGAEKANDAIYNVRGQKVDKTAKGIVIVNGKKVLKK